MVGRQLTLLQQSAVDGSLPLGTGQPCVFLHCDNCANIRFFNLVMLDLGDLVGLTSIDDEIRTGGRVTRSDTWR